MQSSRVSVPDQVESLVVSQYIGYYDKPGFVSLPKPRCLTRFLTRPAPLPCHRSACRAGSRPPTSAAGLGRARFPGKLGRLEAWRPSGNSDRSDLQKNRRSCLRTLTKLNRRGSWHSGASAGERGGQSQRSAEAVPFAMCWYVISTSFIGADLQQSCRITT